MRLLFSICFFFLITPTIILAQENDNKCHKSTEGTDFWFGFMENRWYHNQNHYLEITVTARKATSFEIKIGPNEDTFNGPYNVNDNGSKQIRIPWETVEAMNSEEAQPVGIHLESVLPVNVYALNYDSNSADVAVIYPVESLGTEYIALCYTPDVNIHSDGYAEGRNSEFLIVATEDSTLVSITPSVITDKNQAANSTFSVWLNMGEGYQVQSANDDYYGQGDLTGSHVSSDKPVAFYSGNLATIVPNTDGMGGYDHLYEQIPPIQSWGREYYIVPLKTRNQDRYRIIASKDNTTINIPGIGNRNLNRGEFYEFTLNSNQPKRLVADKAIMVAQFSQSKNSDGKNGDPFMIILSPASQSKNDVTFVAYDSDPITNFYVNIVSLTSEINNLELTGTRGNIPIQNQFSPYPGSDFSYARVTISSGTFRLRNTNPDKGFLAYVYGFGNFESYGYGIGFNLDLVLDIGQSINFEGDTLNLCFGEERVLDAGPYFDTYEWSTNDSSQTIRVTEEKLYWAHTTTNEGCNLYDSIYIKINKPKFQNKLDDAEGCFPYSVELLVEEGFSKYEWKDQDNEILSDSLSMIADQTGSYSITVYDKYECSSSDTMELIVFNVPELTISVPPLVCTDSLPASTVVKTELAGADPELWNFPGSTRWSSNKPGKLNFSDPNSGETSISVSDWGEYTLYFSVITKDSCLKADSITVYFQQTPLSDFRFEKDTKCEGYSQKLFFEGRSSNDANYFWDLDGCMFTDTIIPNNQYNISVGAFVENPPYIKLWIDDRGCLSDTTIHPIGANPVFTMDASPRRGCDSLTVDFSSELLRPDNVEFKWEFDGEAVYSDKVSRFYPSPGFYDVSLTITNLVTQCKNGFTLDSMIKVFPTPKAEFSADPTFCYTDSLDLIYLNNIDSSFCFWSFDGAHKLNMGNDSIKVQIDSAIAYISLQVDEFGCKSDTVTIPVKRKPHFDFYTIDEEGCQPYNPQIFSSTNDDSLVFSWVHDTLAETVADSDFYLFDEPGEKTVSLIAFSKETQCTDTLTKTDWITVHPKPYAAFEVNYPVATIENPDITFSNNSAIAQKYYWDFGDSFNSTLENPQHSYSEIGEYNVNMIAESDFTCRDTADFLIQIVPFSVFTPNAFRPNSDIPENRLFMPVGIGADPDKFNIKIYTRWGTLVFESNHPEDKWDGKTLSGKPAPMGNYIWESNYYDIQGIEHSQNGYVILIR